jgi:hypothetical protein
LGGVVADISAGGADSGVDVEGLGVVVAAGTDLVVAPPGVGILAGAGEVVVGHSCGVGDESAVYASVVFEDETVGGVAGDLEESGRSSHFLSLCGIN